eukprot:GEMP01059737.1.p1 GENE.GEMP01059737.1~~GEMP01059737.1.p1  ORF type:complete len:163 (+),score=47.01 GEMP01059737.1:273-761(+)
MDTNASSKTLTEQEAKEQRKKIDDAKKNSNVAQQKVRELNHFVENLRSQRERFRESLNNLNTKLREKDKEIAKLTDTFEKGSARMAERKLRAARLKKEIRVAEKHFHTNVDMCRTVNKSAVYGAKEVTTNYTSSCLAAERGYDCKPGSTYGHVAQTMARSFF